MLNKKQNIIVKSTKKNNIKNNRNQEKELLKNRKKKCKKGFRNKKNIKLIILEEIKITRKMILMKSLNKRIMKKFNKN